MTKNIPPHVLRSEVDITLCPGLFVKSTVLGVGQLIDQHAHTFPHLSVVAHGAVRVWANGQLLGDYEAPAGIVIEARVSHRFFALRPNTTVLCVHRLNEDGEVGIIEDHAIVEEA